MSEIIFDLTRKDWTYKGVFFGEMDNAAVDSPFPTPKGYVAGMMAIIWINEKGIWHMTARVKFPSGNKQVIRINYKEESNKGIKINETLILHELYKLPMINKLWCPNESGTPDGIFAILEKTDMIESIRWEKIDAKH